MLKSCLKLKPQHKADLQLLMITAFWGLSYVYNKLVLADYSPLNLIALRFILAFFITAFFYHKRLFRSVLTIKYALVLGCLLFVVFAAHICGLVYTTASNAGLLASVTVISVPVVGVFFGQSIRMREIYGMVLAVLGMVLLTYNEHMTVNPGDALVIFGSIVYAFHIIYTGRYTTKVDSVALGVWQMGVVGVLSFVASLIFEIPKLPQLMYWSEILILSLLCTAIAFIVQTVAQNNTTPIHTGFIFALEPLFAAVFAYAYFGEILTVLGYVGAALLFSGTLLAVSSNNA